MLRSSTAWRVLTPFSGVSDMETIDRDPWQAIVNLVRGNSGQITVTEIAAMSGRNRRSITRWVSRLVSIGYIAFGEASKRPNGRDPGRGGPPGRELVFIKSYDQETAAAAVGTDSPCAELLQAWKACGAQRMTQIDFDEQTRAKGLALASPRSAINAMRTADLLRVCGHTSSGRRVYELGDPKMDVPRRPHTRRSVSGPAAEVDDNTPEDYSLDIVTHARKATDRNGVFGVDGLPRVNSVFSLGSLM